MNTSIVAAMSMGTPEMVIVSAFGAAPLLFIIFITFCVYSAQKWAKKSHDELVAIRALLEQKR